MTIFSAIPLATVAMAALIAGYWDIRYRTIPPWLTAMTSMAGIAAQMLRFGWPGFVEAIEAGTLALSVVGLLYLAGLIGGGDLKLFAAISCAVGLHDLMTFARLTGLLGALLALLYMAGGIGGSGNQRGLPYGVAVGTAGVITLFWFR
jgi:prepilin peptidase CpaA